MKMKQEKQKENKLPMKNYIKSQDHIWGPLHFTSKTLKGSKYKIIEPKIN